MHSSANGLGLALRYVGAAWQRDEESAMQKITEGTMATNTNLELEGLSTVQRGIKLCATSQLAGVMHCQLITLLGIRFSITSLSGCHL